MKSLVYYFIFENEYMNDIINLNYSRNNSISS